jgi:hypothetical protein
MSKTYLKSDHFNGGDSSLNIDLSPVGVSCSQYNVNIPYSDIDQVIYQETKQSVYRATPGRVDHYPPKITPKDVPSVSWQAEPAETGAQGNYLRTLAAPDSNNRP